MYEKERRGRKRERQRERQNPHTSDTETRCDTLLHGMRRDRFRRGNNGQIITP
jgi:hypothetical protein